MLCHGNPDERTPGQHCCWVNGEECPNLLRGQEVADAVQVLVDLYNFKGQAKNLANRIGDGITFGCHVALKVIAEHIDATGQGPDRATFEAAWTAHPDYEPIADVWESMNKPRSWCSEYGPAEGQCCFSETPEVNAAKAAEIPVQIRNLRSAIQGG